MSLNWGENSKMIVGVGQMVRDCEDNSSGDKVDVDLENSERNSKKKIKMSIYN